MNQREQRPTSEALTENPAGASTDMVSAGPDIALEARRGESALTFEDRQAAITVAFDAGRHYQAGLDVEDRAQALLHTWALESRDMATHYAAKVGPHWLALITECGELDD
jgi:hypothetical protein